MAQDPVENPFSAAMRVIGGKYKISVLWLLSSHDTMRFNELRKTIGESVTPRMLSLSLKELEADGLVRREVVSENPPRVDYSLTSIGMSLLPVLEELTSWGAAYQDYEAARGVKRRGGPRRGRSHADVLRSMASMILEISLSGFFQRPGVQTLWIFHPRDSRYFCLW